jgi:predicted DNA-binding transcriptional regulator AlpA
MSEEKQGARRMIDVDELLRIVPLARTTIYKMEKAGTFPKSKFITPNRRVWFEDEVLHWQEHGLDHVPSRRRPPRRKA